MANRLLPYLRRTIGLQKADPSLGLLQYRNLLTAGRYAALFDLAARCLAPAQRVLDWGCGNGHFVYFLASQGLKPCAFSLDDPPPLLRMLPSNGYEFSKGDKSDPIHLPYPDAFFDRVFSIGVLEHVREFGGNEKASLAEIRRILKPGGLFIVYHIPNAGSWIEFGASLVPGKHHHDLRFSRSGARRLLEGSGFEVLELRSYGILPRWMMGRLPAAVANATLLAGAFNALDGGLEKALPVLCTNHLAVARKP